jgi:hypothetical protein
MTRKMTTVLAATVIAGIGTAAVFAEDLPNSPHPPQAVGAMDDQGGMMKMMGQMSPDQMQQMMRMIGDCDRMMENKSGKIPAATPDHPKG